MAGLNIAQRIILVIAGVLLVLYGIDAASSFEDSERWRGLAMALSAVGCFVFAAGTRRKPDAE